MAKSTILKSSSFTSVRQYKAICKEKDLKSVWKSTENEAILDALAHQNGNMSHRVEILVQEKLQYSVSIGQDKIDNALQQKGLNTEKM